MSLPNHQVHPGQLGRHRGDTGLQTSGLASTHSYTGWNRVMSTHTAVKAAYSVVVTLCLKVAHEYWIRRRLRVGGPGYPGPVCQEGQACLGPGPVLPLQVPGDGERVAELGSCNDKPALFLTACSLAAQGVCFSWAKRCRRSIWSSHPAA